MKSSGTQLASEVSSEAPSPLESTADTRWIDLALVLFVAFSGPVVIAIYALFNPSYFSTPTQYPGLSMVSLLLRDGTAFLVLAYALRRQRRSIRDLGISFRWFDPFVAMGIFLLAEIAHLLLDGIEHRAASSFGVSLDARHVAWQGWNSRSASEFLHSLSSPIFEEVLVRGYLMTEMLELGKPAFTAVWVSVVLQASYHLYYGVSAAISLSGAFAVFAIYFAVSRKLMPVILAHLFWDMFVYFTN